MDKTGITVISICVLLLVWWFVEQNKFAQQQAATGLSFSLDDETEKSAMVAVQGPKAVGLLDELLPEPVSARGPGEPFPRSS